MEGSDCQQYKKSLETNISIVKKTGLRVLDLRDGYAKLQLPIEPNLNHIGSIYAGSLFTIGEIAGGAIFYACFDRSEFYPIVKRVSIQFLRMASTDVTVEVEMPEKEAERISKLARTQGKCDFELSIEIKDTRDQTCSIVNGVWQIRRIKNSQSL